MRSMTTEKPWEEEWRQEGASYVERRMDTSTVANVMASTDLQENASVVRLVAAAPDMARALLAVLEQVEYIPRSYTLRGAPRANIKDACRQVRAALAKAGVL